MSEPLSERLRSRIDPDRALCCEAADLIDALVEAQIGAVASLAAAISLLERGGKKAAPSDKLFAVMLDDYRKSLDGARAVLARAKGASGS